MARRINRLKNSLSERVVILVAVFVIAAIILVIRLFSLQVVNGEEYYIKFKDSIVRETSITAPRGYIYDRFGIPLASTKIVYNLKYNKSDKENNLSDHELNEMLLEVVKILDKYNRDVIDDIPISEERPYKFLYTSETRIKNWQKNDIGFREKDVSMDAEVVMSKMYEMFGIEYPNEPEYIRRRLCAIRYGIHIKRYYGYIPLDIASDIDDNIIIAIEERKDEFPRIMIEAEPVRNYELGKAFTHILGYVGKINEEEYEEMKDFGYSNDDIVGKVGVEKEMENYLKGTNGMKYVEVDNLGRTMSTTNTVEAKKGNDVYLTIDSVLQTKIYDMLETQLNQGIINRLNGAVKDYPLSITTAYNALAASDAINLSLVLKATNGVQKSMQDKILESITEEETYRQCFTRLATLGLITPREMLTTLVEQGKINDLELIRMIKNNAGLSTIMVKALEKKQINAEDLRIDPCTGSVVVEDVNTGEILALVNYPSYDANRLVGNFDQKYYIELLNNKNTPMLNRALAQRKAPGSVFKMITAIAALETGTITENTRIYDKAIFTDAGNPAAKCWKYPDSHGSIDVKTALEVSCNYFFYRVGMDLGKGNNGSYVKLKAINTISKYAEMFGLGEKSGIELSSMEYRPEISNATNKEKQVLLYNKNADQYDTRWYDGDTIRTAIGQAYNIFAPIHITKYISTIASNGTRYTPYLIDRVEFTDNTKDVISSPKIEQELDIKDKTFDIVKEGMYKVTNGPSGTARYVFSTCDVIAAGKTGTAQETNKPDFAWFAGFAPYDNPQIALTVMIPYATNTSYSSILARDVFNEYFSIDYSNDLLYKENVLTK